MVAAGNGWRMALPRGHVFNLGIFVLPPAGKDPRSLNETRLRTFLHKCIARSPLAVGWILAASHDTYIKPLDKA